MPDSGESIRRAEPAFNAPWPVIGLMAALVAAHGARMWLGFDADRFALSAADLNAGRWGGLVTHLFIHASWAHVLLNSVFILAFGTPVARYLRTGARGAFAFLTFFLACGVLAGAGFAVVAQVQAGLGLGSPDWAVVGASGAASGLMGAAARLIEGRGGVGRLTGRTVVGMTMSWITVNLMLGIGRQLHVVAHHPGATTAGGHRASIGIGQRQLLVGLIL